jgi:hypothetical protein
VGNKPGYYSRRMDDLRVQFGGKCQRADCDLTQKLEFAHTSFTGVYGRGRGLPQRVHDITRNPDSYRLLCVKHHREFDRCGSEQRVLFLARLRS